MPLGDGPADNPKTHPEPAPIGKVTRGAIEISAAESELDKLINASVRDRKLLVKRKRVLPSISAKHFVRARIEMEVAGPEAIIFPWIDALQSSKDYRGVASIRLNPTRNDDTQLDAKVLVEQWVPLSIVTPKEIDEKRDQIRRELYPLLERDQSPLALLTQIAACRPEKRFLLERAYINNTLDEEGRLDRNIRIHGSTSELKTINAFVLALTKRNAVLSKMDWTTPPPLETRTGEWAFAYSAYPARPENNK